MDNNDLLKCCIESKRILETYSLEGRTINFSQLEKKLSVILGQKVSYECLWRSLAIVNRQSWRERKVLLSVIVRCNYGLPGMKFWVQAKNFGAITVVPFDHLNQRLESQKLSKELFEAYKNECNSNISIQHELETKLY